MADAKFEDGDERPLYLGAEDADDLRVVSTLVQDAVFPIGEMSYRPAKRQFALLINRFRWEDPAEVSGRGVERVQSLLSFDGVMGVRTQGIDRSDKDTVLSLLSLEWKAGADGTGVLEMVLAGDGAVALEMEALDATLRDVTRPYLAPSRKTPQHG